MSSFDSNATCWQILFTFTLLFWIKKRHVRRILTAIRMLRFTLHMFATEINTCASFQYQLITINMLRECVQRRSNDIIRLNGFAMPHLHLFIFLSETKSIDSRKKRKSLKQPFLIFRPQAAHINHIENHP